MGRLHVLFASWMEKDLYPLMVGRGGKISAHSMSSTSRNFSSGR